MNFALSFIIIRYLLSKNLTTAHFIYLTFMLFINLGTPHTAFAGFLMLWEDEATVHFTLSFKRISH